MRIKPKRRTGRVGPLRINRSGLRITSVTIDLGLWSGVLWERKRS
jgi:hypothetical protein